MEPEGTSEEPAQPATGGAAQAEPDIDRYRAEFGSIWLYHPDPAD
jgi:hypothetical protein